MIGKGRFHFKIVWSIEVILKQRSKCSKERAIQICGGKASQVVGTVNAKSLRRNVSGWFQEQLDYYEVGGERGE